MLGKNIYQVFVVLNVQRKNTIEIFSPRCWRKHGRYQATYVNYWL